MDERGLGKQLQTARQAAGLTQQQLCSQANLSFSTLTKIERGAIKAPSVFTIQAIAGALGVGLDELMGLPSPARSNRVLQKTRSGASFIYFDVNGCLVHYFQRAFSELAKDTGAPADQIETAYLHFNNDVCRGVMSLSDYHAKLAERLGIDSVDWQAYYLAAIEPIERMQEVLVWASESYKVGLFTNIMPGFLSSMRRTGKIPNLKYDAIIDSSEVGAIKPDAKIYEIAQERAGVPPEEILLIDDDPFNLAAAERAGWKAISFDDARLEESITYVRQALEPAV